MPDVSAYRCDNCGFSLPSGWGGCMYVTDQDGKRILCLHPIEEDTIEAVLGVGAPRKLIEQRTGFLSDCICSDCLENVELDLKRDLRICSKCNSGRVVAIRELIGKLCPKCQDGTIQKIETGITC